MICQIRFQIDETSAVAEARRGAASLVEDLGFDETARGTVALVVTEAATNLATHAVDGELLLRRVEHEGAAGIELLSLDRGPGIANVSECLRDGYSTSRSPGNGLGAIARMADEFDIHSVKDKGTVLFMRLWSNRARKARPRPIEFGVVCLPKPGEEECGDAWHVEWRNGRCAILVADGLGHGPDAAIASQEAVNTLRKHAELDPASLIELSHGALRTTRGAALSIVEFSGGPQLRYAGIGNVTALLKSPDDDRHMASIAGIVGHEVRKIKEFKYTWSSDALLMMHTDGLATHFNLEQYPGLLVRHPAIIAGTLYRDFARGNDDVTVLVGRKL